MYASANREDELLVSWCNEALCSIVELLLTTHCLESDQQLSLLKLFYSQIVDMRGFDNYLDD